LAIRAFDIQSGWRDAYESQREYTTRDIFMGKLNPEKFSPRLKDLNKYLDYTPIERTTLSDKTIKAYGKSLPEDQIMSIMGRAIPPEWTVNLFTLGKNLGDWRIWKTSWICTFRGGKQINRSRSLQRWLERCQGKNERKRKNSEGTITIQVVDAVALAKAILPEEDRDKAVADAVEEETTIVSIWKMLNVSIVAKRATIILTAQLQEKMTMNSQTWFPSQISKTYFNLLWKTCWPKRTNKQRRKKAEVDDE
jgi:hypothetical protein